MIIIRLGTDVLASCFLFWHQRKTNDLWRIDDDSFIAFQGSSPCSFHCRSCYTWCHPSLAYTLHLHFALKLAAVLLGRVRFQGLSWDVMLTFCGFNVFPAETTNHYVHTGLIRLKLLFSIATPLYFMLSSVTKLQIIKLIKMFSLLTSSSFNNFRYAITS